MAATGNKQMHFDLKIEMVSHVIKNYFYLGVLHLLIFNAHQYLIISQKSWNAVDLIVSTYDSRLKSNYALLKGCDYFCLSYAPILVSLK